MKGKDENENVEDEYPKCQYPECEEDCDCDYGGSPIFPLCYEHMCTYNALDNIMVDIHN